METAMRHDQTAGAILRQWRRRRGLSQLDLASDAGISQRHLSFVETGRSSPSRDMTLHLADMLDVPLRERNALLAAAGYAPVYRDRGLEDPAMDAPRRAVERILAGHMPYPAIAIDRHWNLLQANDAAQAFMNVDDPALLTPPVNVLRLSLHPEGLAGRIVNYSEWRSLVLKRITADAQHSGDAELMALVRELGAYPAPPGARIERPPLSDPLGGIAVPLRLASEAGDLSFISATTVFGTPSDISLAELAIESFFPADAATAKAMRALAEAD
jgi:transcriptional regulator with XRE-family HTH domain